MNYTNIIAGFGPAASLSEIEQHVAVLRKRSQDFHTPDVYKTCFGCIDLTSLRASDTPQQITAFVRKVTEIKQYFPRIPELAAVCVFPDFVETAGLAIGDGAMKIASVAGGFPSAHTFLEVKLRETEMAAENGADEIDIVLNLGLFLADRCEEAGHEIAALKSAAGDGVLLKVILETGILKTPEQIRKASLLAMSAGADFIKTSTGKEIVSATPQAAVIMCDAIRDFFAATGKRVGFKAAGGIATPEDATLYYTIVNEILGAEWLNPTLFRIGASSLANNLLSAIEGRPVNYF